MGRGNIRKPNDLSSVTYIDNNNFNFYCNLYVDPPIHGVSYEEAVKLDPDSKNWEFDELTSEIAYDEFVEYFMEAVMKRYPSFYDYAKYMKRRGKPVGFGPLLQNELFDIVFMDNESSLCIMIRAIEHDYEDYSALQKGHIENYTNGIREIILDYYDSFSIPTSSWTSGTVTREDYYKHKEEQKNAQK